MWLPRIKYVTVGICSTRVVGIVKSSVKIVVPYLTKMLAHHKYDSTLAIKLSELQIITIVFNDIQG